MIIFPYELTLMGGRKLHVKKVKCTLVQALRLCTGRTAHRGSRGIALLFYDHGTRRGWWVSVTPRPLFTPGKDPVPIVHEAGWAPGPVWTDAENLAPHPGFDPRSVQPVASRYTDWATGPTRKLYNNQINTFHVHPVEYRITFISSEGFCLQVWTFTLVFNLFFLHLVHYFEACCSRRSVYLPWCVLLLCSGFLLKTISSLRLTAPNGLYLSHRLIASRIHRICPPPLCKNQKVSKHTSVIHSLWMLFV